MALGYFLVQQFPDRIVPGLQGDFFVSAIDGVTGAVIPTYVGTVTFTAPGDPLAKLPAPYTFTLGDSGTHAFRATFNSLGNQRLIATDLVAGKAGNQLIVVEASPAGWGLDPYGKTPFGSAIAGIGTSIVSALALSTHEVQVTLSAPALHNSGTVDGDALNPATWAVQRLDSLDFLNVVAVSIVTPQVYVITTLQPFGPFTVLHEISSSTLLDVSGHLLASPRKADFYGVIDVAVSTPDLRSVSQRVAVQDVANPQALVDSIGGTLKVTAAGDYQNVAGVELLKKLLIRRFVSKPGDFFHLPNYGIGLRVKQVVPSGDLVKLKAEIEAQALREPEVQVAQASLTLDANGILTVLLSARLKQTGQEIQVGVTSPIPSVAL